MFDELVAETEAEYHRLGHTLGWRFVTSPRRTVSPQTDIVFLTLNPAGERDRPDHPSASSEAGSAYVVESWDSAPGQSKLQKEVRTLYLHKQARVSAKQAMAMNMPSRNRSAGLFLVVCHFQ